MKTYARPVAYVRRSARSRSDPGDLSREFQTDKVRELAGAGTDLRIIDADWGRSAATDKTDRRAAFLALLEEIERGEITTVYAYSTDRLARSVEWSARLLNACRRAGTVIVTSEGRFEPDNAMTDQLFHFQAIQNEGYSRQASQKRRATVERQRARGSRLGVAPYGGLPGEDVAPIIAAFREAGSCYGAARILNAAGSTTRRGALWTSKVVGDLLRREGVAYRRKPRPGAKAQADWIVYQLLTCPCGNTMTAMDRRSPRVTCYKARHDPAHPRPHGIALSKLLPALHAEAARLRVPVDAVEMADDADQQRSAIAEKRERIIDMFADGTIRTKADRDVRLAKLDDELDALDAAHVVVTVPQSVDWSQPPATVNAILRAMWSEVRLGPDLLPAPDGFAWRREEWRA